MILLTAWIIGHMVGIYITERRGMNMTNLAWHFVGATLRDGRPIPPDGEWLVHDGPLVLCHSGLHCSIDPFDALSYAPGPVLCRVEYGGEVSDMTNAITTTSLAVHPVLVDRLDQYAEAAQGAFSANTERLLRTATKAFAAWCDETGCCQLPATPETVAAFIDSKTGTLKPATIRTYLSCIAHMHRAADLPDPTKSKTVGLAMSRLGRRQDARQRQAAPFNEEAVRRVMMAGDGPMALRDQAMILVARDLMARRGELVKIQVDDITFDKDGTATVLIRRSKTDKIGRGRTRWLSPRTTDALKNWLAHAGIADGPVFRPFTTDHQIKAGGMGGSEVSRIFKRLASRAGLDPTTISGHSARVGMTQDLVENGAELPEVMQAGDWKTAEMPSRYAANLEAGRGAVARYYSKRSPKE